MKIKTLIILGIILFTAQTQLNTCLSLKAFISSYETDLSECHKKIANGSIRQNVIGTGSYGTVIGCSMKTADGREVGVAVKIIDMQNSLMPSSDIVKQQINEELINLDNINRLKTAWLPLYYGCIYDEPGQTIYIFMERLDTTIEKILEDPLLIEGAHLKKLDVENQIARLLRIMLQAARGVEQLHNIGISHADINQRNLMLKEDARVFKLIDFGFACVADVSRYKEAVNTKGLIDVLGGSPIQEDSSHIFCDLRQDIKELAELFDSIFKKLMLPFATKDDDKTALSDICERVENNIAKMKSSDGYESIQDVIKWLASLLEEQHKYDHLLDTDKFTPYYYQHHADELQVKLFELKAGCSNTKAYLVESFEELRKEFVGPGIEAQPKAAYDSSINKEAHKIEIDEAKRFTL